MSAPVTAIYTALSACLVVVLIFRVGQVRRSEQVGLGTDGSPLLLQRVRAHGNATEFLPITLLLMLVTELNNALSPTWLHLLGALLIVSRIAHAWGLETSPGTSAGRVFGTLGNLLVIAVLAASTILNVVLS